MKKKTIAIVAVGAALVGALLVTGCTRVRLADTPAGTSGKVTVDNRSLELNGADKLTARMRMGVGDLWLAGSATSGDTLSARFEYAPSSWKPDVEFETDGTEARFNAEHPRPLKRLMLQAPSRTPSLRSLSKMAVNSPSSSA